MKTRYYYIIALAAGVLAFCGCQRDEFASMEYAQSDAVVRFAPSIAAMSGDGLTRATLHNTTGDNTHKLSEYLTEFQVAAWEGTSGNTPFITAETKVKYFTAGEDGADSYWSTVDGSDNIKEYKWKKTDATKTFFAWANLPASGASVECTSAASQTLTLTALPDKDILLGFYSGDGSTGSPAKKTGTASIHFYHPLTAVQFKKGTLSDGVRISGISIEGVYTSGKTTQTPSTGTAFAWTKTNGSAFAATDETGTVSLSDVTVDDDGFIGDAIVLIPQTFASDEARVTVTLATPTGEETIYYQLKGKTFSAGYTNVLTIGYENDYLDVNINQSIVSGIAGSLGVRNVGNDNAYIRLAVTSCWTDADGNILQGYTDFTAGGTATGLNTTDWAKGTDGFYYYKKAIGPGKNTKALFTSFEPGEAPMEGLKFEMMVSVQAVGGSYAEGNDLSDNAKAAWGTGIPVADEIEE